MAKIDNLEPVMKTKVTQLLHAAHGATGYKWIITSGRRSMSEQRAIYAQGRTEPGKIVSNAPPGSSAHNFGLAADLVPLKANGTVWWDAPKDIWAKMGEEAEKLGLTWGGRFKTIRDQPHVEHPSWKDQRNLWKQGKLHVE